MKKLLFILTALVAVGCSKNENFTPAGKNALFSYTFSYDSTLGSQTTNTKEVYHISGKTLSLTVNQVKDEKSKELIDMFLLYPESKTLDYMIAELDGEYASITSIDLSTVGMLDYDETVVVDTGVEVSSNTSETGVTTTTYASEAHPAYIVLCPQGDDDYIGFAVRVVSVKKVVTVDPEGTVVPPSTPFGDPTYTESTDYQVYVEAEYKAFNKSGWL